MTTSSASYLQTLAKDEATAFVASLQKVQAHLSQELQCVSEQVQQKTAQLQSIETLLLEAEALGLVAADPHPIPGAASAVAATVTPVVAAAGVTHESSLELPATEDGSTLPTIATEPVAAAIAALPSQKTAKQPRGQQGKVDPAKSPRSSKPSTTSKSGTVKAKQANLATPPASKAAQRGKASPLQPFLKSQWRDKALTEAVGDILNQATAPLSADAVMAALYDGLPQADYDRAKHSLANILSAGRSKGSWRSVGRGLYAGKAIATA